MRVTPALGRIRGLPGGRLGSPVGSSGPPGAMPTAPSHFPAQTHRRDRGDGVKPHSQAPEGGPATASSYFQPHLQDHI